MAKKQQDAALKYSRVSPTANVIFSLIFILLALLCFLPALLVCIVSFSSEASVLHKGYSFFPDAWSIDSYAYLARQADYVGRAFLNSIGITVVGTCFGLILCSTMGYALSRPNYRLRGFFTWFVFIPMLFSGGLVASYMINAQVLGLKNTYWVLILPICCSSFYIIIMRTFFQTTVPDAIIESAKIDGARQIRIFVQIVLPISLPAIATIGLFYTFAYWNDWIDGQVLSEFQRAEPLPASVRADFAGKQHRLPHPQPAVHGAGRSVQHSQRNDPHGHGHGRRHPDCLLVSLLPEVLHLRSDDRRREGINRIDYNSCSLL